MSTVLQEPITNAPTPTRSESPYARAQRTLDTALSRFSVPLLRIALGIVFVWFGALKVFDVTPVGDLVAGALPWFDPTWFVPALGGIEVALGLLLFSGRLVGWTCAALVGHLCGTFLVYVMQPDVAFIGGNPLLMTTEGEFVAKNVVLITAALVVATWSRRRRRGQ